MVELTHLSEAKVPQCVAFVSGLSDEGRRILLSCLSQRDTASQLRAGVEPMLLVEGCAGGLPAD